MENCPQHHKPFTQVSFVSIVVINTLSTIAIPGEHIKY